MSLYVFSLLSGYEKSGVDVAQGKRISYFDNLGINAKCVFTKIPVKNDFDIYLGAGIKTQNIIIAPLWYAGLKDALGKFNYDEFIAIKKEKLEHVKVEQDNSGTIRNCSFYSHDERLLTIRYLDENISLCEVYYYHKNQIVAKEVYSKELLYTDYYEKSDITDRPGEVVRRCIKDLQGYEKINILFKANSQPTYVLDDGRMLDEVGFIDVFIKSLELSAEDMVIIDRPGYMNYFNSLLKYKNGAYFAVFLHSSHYNELYGSYGKGLNIEYLKFFQHSEYIDSFIVSTDMQGKDLADKLVEYNCNLPDIEIIPAGGLDKVRRDGNNRKKHGIITTCRISPHKGVDWMVKAVIKAHDKNEKITFDIYGGTAFVNYKKEIDNIIENNNASEYIKLKGEQDVREKYLEYEMYLTASRGESLGLSMMEAVASGNAIVGLNTKYGSGVFIKTGINGIGIDLDIAKMTDESYREEIIDKLAGAIVEVFADEKIKDYAAESYNIAEEFMDDVIQGKWKDFFERIKTKRNIILD